MKNQYSENVVSLSRETPFHASTLHTAEKMLDDRRLEISKSSLSAWCRLAAKQNMSLHDTIACMLIPVYEK